jgi:hypothetical protein
MVQITTGGGPPEPSAFEPLEIPPAFEGLTYDEILSLASQGNVHASKFHGKAMRMARERVVYRARMAGKAHLQESINTNADWEHKAMQREVDKAAAEHHRAIRQRAEEAEADRKASAAALARLADELQGVRDQGDRTDVRAWLAVAIAGASFLVALAALLVQAF